MKWAGEWLFQPLLQQTRAVQRLEATGNIFQSMIIQLSATVTSLISTETTNSKIAVMQCKQVIHTTARSRELVLFYYCPITAKNKTKEEQETRTQSHSCRIGKYLGATLSSYDQSLKLISELLNYNIARCLQEKFPFSENTKIIKLTLKSPKLKIYWLSRAFTTYQCQREHNITIALLDLSVSAT